MPCYLPRLHCSISHTLTKPRNELICLGKDIQTRNPEQSQALVFQGRANHIPKSISQVSLLFVSRRKCLPNAGMARGSSAFVANGGQGLVLLSGMLGAHPSFQHPLARQNKPLVPPDPAHDSVDLHSRSPSYCPNNFRICHGGIFIILSSLDTGREPCCFPAQAGFTGRGRGRKL